MRLSLRASLALLAPLSLVLAALVIAPACVFFAYSFFDFELLEPQPGFNPEHYASVVGEEINRRLAWNTVRIAVPTTAVAVCAGFALAYRIALCEGRAKMILIGLVVASMLASYLARIYALRTLLGDQGIVSTVIQAVGIGDGAPAFLLFSRASVVIGQVNFLLPFTTLVLFAGLSGMPAGLREAGRDLGARRWTVFRRVTLPLAGPALLVATTFTFFLSAGDYLTPQLLGGSDGTTFGTAVTEQIKVTGNYPLGAALSFSMVAAFAAAYGLVWLAMRALGLLPRVGARA